MNSITFYDKFIISSYFISNFNLSNSRNIKKLKIIRVKILFKSLTKLNFITTLLSFAILTQTKPSLIKGLKNYKENRIELKGLTFLINKKKYIFLYNFLINDLLEDNKDAIKRLKSLPTLCNTLVLEKYLENIFVDKIYQLSNSVRNTAQVQVRFTPINKKMGNLFQSFLFNVLINESVFPTIIK
jgi:hypothetical protein